MKTGLFAAILLLVPAVSFAQVVAGDLDASFGSGGKATTDLSGGADHINAIALQPDGKIVAVGFASLSGNTDFALARYNPDGSLDATFGSGGKTSLDFGGRDEADAVVLQPDGKILAAGSSLGAASSDFALARFLSNGAPDTSFNLTGKVTTDFGGADFASGIALQADLNIVVVGFTQAAMSDPDFAVARYQPDGKPDLNFDLDGRVITNFSAGSEDGASSVAIQPADQKIVVAGFSNFDFAVARYQPNGGLDTSFDPLGLDGKVTLTFGGLIESAFAMVVQPDGKILLAGDADVNLVKEFALARFDADGGLDAGFGSAGRVLTGFAASHGDSAHAVAVDAGGRILAAGYSQADFGLARYASGGALDVSFQEGGLVTTDFDGGSDAATAVAIQTDGFIVVGGYADVGGQEDFALARYHPESVAAGTTGGGTATGGSTGGADGGSGGGCALVRWVD
ncbi:MAG TPA: hypothetical protein VLJ37_08890 [bacterium]|nr:hypothetical protein [bacterium]